ncbi:MAG: type I restriction enzyme endonuclease domain-containing protein, partial [Gammaproteobacteria bacterium]
AQTACQKSGHNIIDHFSDLSKMVELDSKSQREVEDFILTRYACYLIAQNGDPRKQEIAFAQTYFALHTGFDVPCLPTMYMDKPLCGHNLMQAIAAMIEKYEIVAQMFNHFDYKRYFAADTREKLRIILEAQDHILRLSNDGANRFIKHVTALAKVFAFAVPAPAAIKIRDEVGFFLAIKARLVKFERSPGSSGSVAMETAIRQIVEQAIVGDEVIDVFASAGIKKPDFSILSDEFLQEIRGMKLKNVALALLTKLLHDEIKIRGKKNVIQSRNFSEMLEEAIRKYQNKLLTVAEVINELITLAKAIRHSAERGKKMGLSDDEIAFYDALANNESARDVLGDKTLRRLAQVLVIKVKANTRTDWTIKESVQTKLRVIVKNTLRRYKYPPDEEKLATDNVIRQAELFANDWAAAA